jgi:putative addiction module component (TIGR02574 family)
MKRKTLLSDILELSVAERLQLVEEIWDSIADVPEGLDLTEAQKVELDRRLDEYRKDPSIAIPWDVVKAGIGF